MNKKKYMNIRVSEMDFDKIQQASERENISLSEYVRTVLIDASEATLMGEKKHDLNSQILEDILNRISYVQGHLKLDLLGKLPANKTEQDEMVEGFVEGVRDNFGLDENDD